VEVPQRILTGISPRWQTVRTGLAVLHAGLVLTLLGTLAILVTVVGPMLQEHNGPRPDPPEGDRWMGLLFLGGILAAAVGWLLTLVGQCIALATPEARARGWGIAAVVCNLLSKLLAAFAVLLFVAFLQLAAAPEILGRQRQPGNAIALALPVGFTLLVVGSGVASLAEVVCVALFVRALGQFFSRQALVRRAGSFACFAVTFTVIVVGLNFLAGYLLAKYPRDPQFNIQMARVLLIGESVCFLIVFGQFIGLVKEGRDAVDLALGISPRADAPE
jgi:hypothetical protein